MIVRRVVCTHSSYVTALVFSKIGSGSSKVWCEDTYDENAAGLEVAITWENTAIQVQIIRSGTRIFHTDKVAQFLAAAGKETTTGQERFVYV